MRTRRVVAVAAIVAFVALAGAAWPQGATLKDTTLKLYCVGDSSPGSAMVLAEANKALKQKINATLSLEYLPWADWTNKYQLAFAAGEDFDGIYTANWSFYATMATKNAFKEITQDMLRRYAPDLLSDLPEMAWKQARINGKVYMIPTTFDEHVAVNYIVRGDLRAKYKVPEIRTLNDFGAYLGAIAKNEKDMIPLDVSGTVDSSNMLTLFNEMNEYGVVGNVSLANFVYKISDPGLNLVNTFETPAFRAYARTMQSWQQAGYWSRSALSNKNGQAASFEIGKSGSEVNNILQATNYSYAWKNTHPDWTVEAFDATLGNKVLGTPYIGSGLGIKATSKNVERMLMFANLVRTNKDLNQLFCYGVKGVHWKPVGTNKVEYVRGIAKQDYTDGLSWVFRNAKFQLLPAGVFSSYDTIFGSYVKRTAAHILQAFNFDDTGFKNEMAAMSNVVSQYGVPVVLGFVDANQGVDTLVGKMKEAGSDKVMAEIQRQARAFMTANGN